MMLTPSPLSPFIKDTSIVSPWRCGGYALSDAVLATTVSVLIAGDDGKGEPKTLGKRRELCDDGKKI